MSSLYIPFLKLNFQKKKDIYILIKTYFLKKKTNHFYGSKRHI